MASELLFLTETGKMEEPSLWIQSIFLKEYNILMKLANCVGS